MHFQKLFIPIVCFLFDSIAGRCQLPQSTTDARNQLEAINNDMAKAFTVKDTNQFLRYYDPEAVCMPEYHPTLYGKNAIQQYFSQWFRQTGRNGFQRNILDLQIINDYLIETGVFKQIYFKAESTPFFYNGKYLRIWKLTQNKDLKIISEIWGASDYLERTQLPQITSIDKPVIPVYEVSDKIREEVKLRNQLITQLVTERKGEEHAMLFTPDAIYLPYYESMHIGISTIKGYFMEHEKPGDVAIDSLQINTSKMIDLGGLILEHGYYGVRWKTLDNTTGVVTGKSINLWKRDSNGSLLLFRQMVNHD